MKVQTLRNLFFRNQYGMMGRSLPNQVNLEWSNNGNLGDTLSPVIVNWMLEQRNLNLSVNIESTKHLFAVGSVIHRYHYDATVWGSGILRPEEEKLIKFKRLYRKYDIRAVRGPITRNILLKSGYNCPEIYGDPAILLPLIYQPKKEKRHDVSIILHHRTQQVDNPNQEKEYCAFVPNELHSINIMTDDYEHFVDEIAMSKLVISSSLHGIILAESYGIPAVFLGYGVDDQHIKFFDWYYSTGRQSIQMARSVEEAVSMEPMPLPELDLMRINLMESFPYDLWD